jgi:adenine deaminase
VKAPTADDLRIKTSGTDGYARVNVLQYAAFEAKEEFEIKEEKIPITDGYLDISKDQGLKYITVINRYGLDKKTVGLVRNFPLAKGTIGGSVSHDSHNLVSIYSTPEEAVLALTKVIEAKGGLVCVEGDRVTGLLELPVFGLMSRLELEELAELQMEVQHAARELAGNADKDPLMEMAIIALPVRPWATVTDEGLFDLRAMKIRPILIEG